MHVVTDSSVDLSPSRIERAISKLGLNKGTGKDEVPAELLKAGGFPLAVKIADVCARIVTSEVWPVDWCGGRLVDLYKG